MRSINSRVFGLGGLLLLLRRRTFFFFFSAFEFTSTPDFFLFFSFGEGDRLEELLELLRFFFFFALPFFSCKTTISSLDLEGPGLSALDMRLSPACFFLIFS